MKVKPSKDSEGQTLIILGLWFACFNGLFQRFY